MQGDADKRSISGLKIIEDDGSEAHIDLVTSSQPLNFYLSTKSEIPFFDQTIHQSELENNDSYHSGDWKLLQTPNKLA